MGNLRAAWRLLLIALITVFFQLILLFGSLWHFRSRAGRLRCRNFIFRNWARGVLRAINARVSASGMAPEAPFILVANHLSYVDIALIASRVDAVFIAKSEIASWPLVGLLCKSVGTLFVNRSLRRDVPRVVAEIERVLEDGQGVALFAEGTSSGGTEVLKFRPSLLEVAARQSTPVSYASLSYRTGSEVDPARSRVCWWGNMPFAPHAWRLLTLPGFDATLAFGGEPILDDDRKRLAERLHAEVTRLFVPVDHAPVAPEARADTGTE